MILQYLGNMAINGFIKYTNKRNNSTDRGWEERGGEVITPQGNQNNY